jgi:hypothetical protein
MSLLKAQVKAASTSNIDSIPKTILGAAWGPQKQRMDAGVYFPLFLVLVAAGAKRYAIYYLSSDLQIPAMFVPRSPLSATARRQDGRGFFTTPCEPTLFGSNSLSLLISFAIRGEADWRNIRIYCEQEINPFDWDRCLYVVRIAPPFTIVYGDDSELISPLVYVGSGSIANRWSSHRDWLYELGHAIPGGRYEVWVCKPRCQRLQAFYKDIEADILTLFREKSGYLPLRNLRVEGTPRQHEYAAGFLDEIMLDRPLGGRGLRVRRFLLHGVVPLILRDALNARDAFSRC